jgi:hypothetical protein
MLHWYRLARVTRAERSRTSAAQAHLIEGRGASPTASLSRQQRDKLFLLGLAEAAPLLAGGVFSIYTDSAAETMFAVPIAMLLTAFLCGLLRHQVPVTRIEFSADTPRPNQALF